MAKTLRVERVTELIHHQLATLLRTEIRDPRLASVTITGIEVSVDLKHAKVFYVLHANEGATAQQEAEQAFEKAKGFLRHNLGERLALRVVPDLRFVLDTSFERAMELGQLIDRAIASDKENDKDSEEN